MNSIHADDGLLRRELRRRLPPDTFLRRPVDSLWLIPHLMVIVGGTALLILSSLHWTLALLLAVLIGNSYASLMFLAHEAGHGAMIRSNWLKSLLMYPGSFPFLLSPRLWRVWHNAAHHGHANHAELDPDHFGTLAQHSALPARRRWVKLFAPGSGHPLSLLYLLCFFTIQGHYVLWIFSRKSPEFNRFSRRAAAMESLAMLLIWIGIGVASGWVGSLFTILIPMAVANAIVLGYVITNHMLRPLSNSGGTLATTMSVRTLRVLDTLHFHFSHHVEHHLFPAMPSVMYPRVRRELEKLAHDHYLAPSHAVALWYVFTTPKVYLTPEVVIRPGKIRGRSLVTIGRILHRRRPPASS